MLVIYAFTFYLSKITYYLFELIIDYNFMESLFFSKKFFSMYLGLMLLFRLPWCLKFGCTCTYELTLLECSFSILLLLMLVFKETTWFSSWKMGPLLKSDSAYDSYFLKRYSVTDSECLFRLCFLSWFFIWITFRSFES